MLPALKQLGKLLAHPTQFAEEIERAYASLCQGGTYSRDAEIEALMDELYHAPGFRLMRRQIGKLVAFAKGDSPQYPLLQLAKVFTLSEGTLAA